jgi:phospholipase D1/2
MPFDHSFTPDLGKLFNPGQNCTATTVAKHGSVLVDCANYYRDLHESLSKARHSIFILGWDIDSRIHLIRREEDKTHPRPVTLFELLTQKAQENPDLHIYLNKWNYTFLMAETREPMSFWKWKKAGLPNIHYCHDKMIPVGACHHQKIVVVDDEVAFIGGMDVAIARWDTRDHDPDDPHREDPDGLYNANGKRKFKPYHDIQTVVSGEAAQELAKIVRERWSHATGYDAEPIRPLQKMHDIYQSWPDTDPPDFVDIPVAITRTLPADNGKEGTFEIERAYLDQIKTAEKFIYFENQYFTLKKVAGALNERLKQRPDLRVLMVSSYDPQGILEKLSMWAARIQFKKILMEGLSGDQVQMAYPASKSKQRNEFQSVRIHSKIMITDDRYLSIGSANLNNRSMRMDTECDLIYSGDNIQQRDKIASVRNDLISEHSGIPQETVAAMIDGVESVSSYLKPPENSRKKLVEIDDTKFFMRFPTFLATMLADPRKDLIPEILPLPSGGNRYIQYITRRRVIGTFLFFLTCVIGAIAWKQGFFHEYGSKENLTALFQQVQESRFSVPIAISVYTLCATLFMPVTVLTGVTAIIFGYWYGLVISLAGALFAAAITYGAGNLLDVRKIEWLKGGAFQRVQEHAENSNIVGITFLRMLPIAPYAVVNVILGVLRVPFMVFMLATLFGLLPGKITAVFLADSVGEIWRNPDAKNIAILGAGLVAWFFVVWVTHYFYRAWKRKTEAA